MTAKDIEKERQEMQAAWRAQQANKVSVCLLGVFVAGVCSLGQVVVCAAALLVCVDLLG